MHMAWMQTSPLLPSHQQPLLLELPQGSHAASRDSPVSQQTEPPPTSTKNWNPGDGWSHRSTGAAKRWGTSSSFGMAFSPERSSGMEGRKETTAEMEAIGAGGGCFAWRRRRRRLSSTAGEDNWHTGAGKKQDRLS